jgi:IS30 family transposase
MTWNHLRLEERIELEGALRAGDTQAAIAARLGRSAGTLSREIALGGGRAVYRAVVADRAAEARGGGARRGFCAITVHPPLQAAVAAGLRRGWSPEEIALGLRKDYPRDAPMHTSHESIYRYVYILARGELKRELVACLRRHHRHRQPRRRGVTATQGKLKDMVLIDHRPPEVETRLIPGHYEGDLILGAGNRSAVGVLVERQTRFIFLW